MRNYLKLATNRRLIGNAVANETVIFFYNDREGFEQALRELKSLAPAYYERCGIVTFEAVPDVESKVVGQACFPSRLINKENDDDQRRV